MSDVFEKSSVTSELPVQVGETIVGAIGVSGGHYSQDMEVAQAGVGALA
jgi:uncharacterized protein GlcG (DUF336 family)